MKRSPSWPLRSLGLSCLLLFPLACAEKQSSPGSPPPQYAPQPVPALTQPQPPIPMPGSLPGPAWQTPDEAEKALAEAEVDLDGAFSAGTGESLTADRCLRSCKALGSMRRAAARLCELTSESDERCQNARGRVERSAQRIRDAGCSC